MPMNWHSALLVKARLISYLIVAITSVVLFWLHVIPGLWLLPIIFLWGLLSYMERCPICSKPYLLQRGKSILKLGKVCENCGAAIE